MNFFIPDLYNFLCGPGFIISLTLFIAGTIGRLLLLIRATRRIQISSTYIENLIPYREILMQSNIFSKIILILKTKFARPLRDGKCRW